MPPSPAFFGMESLPSSSSRRVPAPKTGRTTAAAARAAGTRSRASSSFLSSAAASGFGSIVSSCASLLPFLSIAFSKRWCMKKARLNVDGAYGPPYRSLPRVFR